MDIVRDWLLQHNFPATVAIAGAEIPTHLICIFSAAALLYALFGRSGGQRKRDAVFEVLTKDRRSVEKYKAAASMEDITMALDAAIYAPNHFLNDPCRFRLLGEDKREGLSKLNEERRALFDQVPQMMLVTQEKASDADWDKGELEKHAAVACAVQNFMLALAGAGVGTKWMTGKLGIKPDDILNLCGVDGNTEHFMGIIFIGKPKVPMATMKVPRRKKGTQAPIFQQI